MSTKERPIIFSGPMVRAILDGRKTQTRRIVKQQPERGVHECPYVPSGYSHGSRGLEGACGCVEIRLPYGKPGDRLWVRETWNLADPGGVDALPDDVYGPTAPFTGCQGKRTIHWRAIYKASSQDAHPVFGKALWRSPIHMPRWASRILLEVVSVRVERLQAISEADALAEGVEPGHGITYPGQHVDAYRALWESIHGPGSWDANPWVWVVEFKRVEGGEA